MDKFSLTGHEILDEIAGLQMDAADFPSGQDRIDRVFDAVRNSRAGNLIGRAYFINSIVAYGKEPESEPLRRIRLPQGAVFTGLAKKAMDIWSMMILQWILLPSVSQKHLFERLLSRGK